MPRGRPTNASKMVEASTTENATMQLLEKMTTEVTLTHQYSGQIQAFSAVSKITTIGALRLLKRIKDERLYRVLGGQKGYDQNGEEFILGTWEAYCRMVGRSVDQVDEDIQNLAALGETALEAVRQVGLGYRELRQLRKMDDSDRQVVVGEIEANAGDKEAILSLIDSLVARHTKEKEVLTKKLDHTQKDLEAARALSAERDRKTRQMEEQIRKWETGAVDYPKWIQDARMETLAQSGKIFQAIDALRALRERILAIPETYEDRDAEDLMTAPVAVLYWTTIQQLHAQIGDLLAVAEETFSGYESLCRLPLADLKRLNNVQ